MTAIAFVDRARFSPAPRQDHSRFAIRAAALSVAVAGHVLLFYVPGQQPPPPPAVETLEISVVAQGDVTNDNANETQSATEVAPPPEPTPAPAPPPAPEPPAQVAELPVKEDPSAIVIPVKKPEPPPPPKVEVQPPKPDPVPQPRPVAKPLPKKIERPSAVSVAKHLSHSGAKQAPRANAGMSVAAYGGKLKAEINRHKVYPAAARAREASGTTMVNFSIGPSGRVSSASITQSSGDSSLDAAALQAVRAASPPPPPGGRFSGRIAIEFALRR